MYIWSLRVYFVQMNIDRPVYVRNRCHNATMVLDISRAVFCTFLGFQKSQILGLAIAGRNGLSVEINQISAGVNNLFLDRAYISVLFFTD